MKNNEVIIEREFPHFNNKKGGSNPLQLLFGLIVWIVLLVVFAAVMYVNWFSSSLVYLLNMVHPKQYTIPFWFSALVTIFLFPVTLFVILVGAFLKIIYD